MLLVATPARAEAIRSVTHIDILPDKIEVGERILRDYTSAVRHDPGVTAITLSQQIDTPNHFVLQQITVSRAAYDRHIEANYTVRFRAKLKPLLRSPWDERLTRDTP